MTALPVLFMALFAFAGPVQAQTATPYQHKTTDLFMEIVDIINTGVFTGDGHGGFATGDPYYWLERVDSHIASRPNPIEMCFDIVPFDIKGRYPDAFVCDSDLREFVTAINRGNVNRINYLIDIFTLATFCGTMPSSDCEEYQRREGL